MMRLEPGDRVRETLHEDLRIKHTHREDVTRVLLMFLLGCTPLKINMKHNHGGLEDHFPF